MAASSDRILLAIGLRLVSVAAMSLMNLGIKLAERAGAQLGEIMFWRQAGATLLIAGVVAAGPGFGSLRTQRFGAHVGRAALGLTGMALTFYTVATLPLAEATTIGFSMPIFATVLGALVLKEPTGWRRWAAVGCGFAGVLIVAQPRGGDIPLTGLLTGIGAALTTATISILLRTFGRTERPLTTVFWFSALSVLPLSCVYAFVAEPHDLRTLAILIAIGLIGGVAQLAMTSSLALGPVGAVVPMDYTALLWATLLGWLAFDHLPAPATWAGAPVIIASGLYIVWREHRRRRVETRQAVLEE